MADATVRRFALGAVPETSSPASFALVSGPADSERLDLPPQMTNPDPQATGGTEPPAPAPAAWSLLLSIAALKLVVLALVGNGYGFHQDEFYYLACGRRPAWGYVDQPPFVPMLGRLAESLFGVASLRPVELRCFSALAGAGVIVLAGLMARELGGRRYAQGLSALAVLVMPLFLATGNLFQTVVFDQLFWALAFWLVLRTLRAGEGHGWLLVGLAAGTGLETKHTMGLFGAGLAVALFATKTGRDHLRTPWPWLGGGVALALLLPNLLWQQAHGWPTAEFIHNSNVGNRADWTLAKFLVLQVIFNNPIVTILIMLGVWWAFSPVGQPAARVVVCVCGVVFAALLALRGKPYYVGPIYPALAALGSVALESLTARRRTAGAANARHWLRPVAAVGVVIGGVGFVPAVLPIIPPGQLAGSWELRLNDDFGRHVGWPELVAQVEAIVRSLPASEQAQTTILSVYYEAAAAIEHFDPALATRIPVISPHNSYWFWGPGSRDPQIVLVIGARHREWLDQLFRHVERVGTIDNPSSVPNEWRGSGIWLCRDPKQTLRSAWPDLKNFD
jgi:hypothetical protein